MNVKDLLNPVYRSSLKYHPLWLTLYVNSYKVIKKIKILSLSVHSCYYNMCLKNVFFNRL